MFEILKCSERKRERSSFSSDLEFDFISFSPSIEFDDQRNNKRMNRMT